LTRDCVALIDPSEKDSHIENIVINEVDGSSPEAHAAALKKLLLSQPDGLIVPDIADKSIMDTLTLQTQDDRSVLTRTKAKSAAEALLRVYAKAGDREQFANAASLATCQRLVRRLCDDCKQKVKVPPRQFNNSVVIQRSRTGFTLTGACHRPINESTRKVARLNFLHARHAGVSGTSVRLLYTRCLK
jgi:type II secretory ATPase GspE/PulE/Tfp pilus assembly ATPase PilB-like protein